MCHVTTIFGVDCFPTQVDLVHRPDPAQTERMFIQGVKCQTDLSENNVQKASRGRQAWYI